MKWIYFILGVLVSITLVSSANFGYNNLEVPQLIPEINYSKIVMNLSTNYSDTSGITYCWSTVEGVVCDIVDIEHQWLSNLAWSVAGHTIDTNIDMNDNHLANTGGIYFNLTHSAEEVVEGLMHWNDDEGTLNLGMKGGNVNLQVGQEQLLRAKATENILNGQAVYIDGADGVNPTVSLADKTTEGTSSKTIGIATEDITSGQHGYVTTFGRVRELNTLSFSEGDMLWLGDGGNLTNIKPTAPNHSVFIGNVVVSHGTEGVIHVKIQNGFEIGELHDVNTSSVSDLDILQYNNSDGVWYPVSLATIYYNATQGQAVTGTVAGSIVDTQHPTGAYDGVTFNITEQVSAPALDVRVNFTDGITKFDEGIMRYYTTGTAGDEPIIQLWDYVEGDWETYRTMTRVDEFSFISQPIYDSTSHVQNGVVQMRLYKSSTGNINNKYYIDWLAIAKGFGTPTGTETDPLSIHTDHINTTQMNYTDSILSIKESWLYALGFLTESNVNNTNINVTSVETQNIYGKNITYLNGNFTLNDASDPVLICDQADQCDFFDDLDVHGGVLSVTMENTDTTGLTINQPNYNSTSNVAMASITGVQNASSGADVRDIAGLDHAITNNHVLSGENYGVIQTTSGITNTIITRAEHSLEDPVADSREETAGVTNLVDIGGTGGATPRTITAYANEDFKIQGVGLDNTVYSKFISYNSAGNNLNLDLFGIRNIIEANDISASAGTVNPILYGYYASLAGSLTATDTGYGYYFAPSSQLTNTWAFYNDDTADIYGGKDNANFIQGTSQDFKQRFDGTNEVYNLTNGGLHYFAGGNISVEGINYHSRVDISADALEWFKDGNEMLNPDGSINHIAFGDCYVNETHTDFSRPVIDENNKTTYPYKTYRDAIDGECMYAKQNQALGLLNKNVNLYENITDFDTGIMAEDYFSQSKVINLIDNYALKFLDASALSSKSTHKNKVVLPNVPEDVSEVLSMEDRIVDLEGAFNDHMFCMYQHPKYEDYRDCMLDVNPKEK